MTWKEVDGKKFWLASHPDPALGDHKLAWVADDDAYLSLTDEEWEKFKS